MSDAKTLTIEVVDEPADNDPLVEALAREFGLDPKNRQKLPGGG